MPVEHVESKSKCLARETQEKLDADTAAAASGAGTSETRPLSEHSFMQFVHMAETKGNENKRSRISFCTVSWHKRNKGEKMEEDEE